MRQTFTKSELAEGKTFLIQSHGKAILRAVLHGFAGVVPRSVMPNMIEVLSTMISHCLQECRIWIPEILYAVSDSGPTRHSHQIGVAG